MYNTYCYDLSMENFSSIYLDNFKLEDGHTGLKKHIIKVIKAGFAFGVLQHIDSVNTSSDTLSKALNKVLMESFHILNNRINRDEDFLRTEEMFLSKHYIDIKTSEYIKRYYDKSSDWKKYTLLSFYQIGIFHGIVYGVKRTAKDFKTLTDSVKIEDTDFPIFLKEYNKYLKKHNIG